MTKRQRDKKAKRQKDKKDKRQRPKREFDIVMSGQFRTLAMFLQINHPAKVVEYGDWGVLSAMPKLSECLSWQPLPCLSLSSIYSAGQCVPGSQ